MAAYDGQLWRLERGSATPVPYLLPRRPTDTFDFAAAVIEATRPGTAMLEIARDERIVARGRDYACKRPRFRRNPRFLATHKVLRMFGDRRGTWTPPWG